MFLKHLFNCSIFISVSASWLNGHLVCMVLSINISLSHSVLFGLRMIAL